MVVAIRPLLALALLGTIALFFGGCGPDASPGFGRVTHLSPTGKSARSMARLDGQLVVHGGEARRSWQTRAGESLLVPIVVTPGARFEVALANAGHAPARARVRVVSEDGEPHLLFDETLRSGGWQDVSIALSAHAGLTVTLSLEVVSAGSGAPGEDAPVAVDWGEPILLEVTGEPAPPNIVLITLDTTRADVAADPLVAPRLAGLAERGTTFDDSWSAATSTTPGHASILTGLSVERHGAVSNRSALSPALVTLAEALAKRGYQTAASVTVDHIGLEAGFGQGFGRFRPAQTGDARDGAASIEAVERWLDGWASRAPRPFFLWVHLFDAHTPYGPPADFMSGELAERGLALPPRRSDPATVPIFPGPLPTPLSWLGGITSRDYVDALYEAGVAYADHLAGRVLDRLTQLGLEDDTVIVVTADHGEALGEQGVFYQHAGLWPASLRVPLIVAGPGWPSGARVDARTSTLDVSPSIVAAADRHANQGPLQRAIDDDAPERRVWFAETGLAQLGFRDAEVHYAQALASGQFGVVIDERADGPHVRAIQRYAPGAAWLFDLHADPQLERNLARDAGSGVDQYRALVRERARRGADPSRRRVLSERAESELRALGYAEE